MSASTFEEDSQVPDYQLDFSTTYISNLNCFLGKCFRVGLATHSSYQQFIEVSLGQERLLVAWKLHGHSSEVESLTFSCIACMGGMTKE